MRISKLVSLLAAGAASPASAEVKFATFFPVALHRPAPPENVTELVSENKYGTRERVRIWYEDSTAVKIAVGVAEKGQAFEDIILPDVEDADSPAAERAITGIVQGMEPFRLACLGDMEAKKQAEERLNKGRADLARDK